MTALLGFTESVESRCGAVAVGWAYLFPPLSFGGASLAQPWLRFHIPLIEPDVQIWWVAQPLLAFAPYRTRRAALPQRALQESPKAGRSSVQRLMDDRVGNREDGQERLVGPPGKSAFLAALAQCRAPELDHAGLKRAKRPKVEDDTIVPVVAMEHLAQPAMLLANRSVHPRKHAVKAAGYEAISAEPGAGPFRRRARRR